MQIFQRVEQKYRMSEEQYEMFMSGIKKYMKPDEHGFTTICNIYFDTEEDDLIRTSLEKPLYKEKVRMRSYGIPNEDSTLFLELKKKYKGVVHKRRMELTYKEAMAYLEKQELPCKESQIKNELLYCTNFYHLKPRCFLAYDRKAYYGINDHNLRITIDYNIRSRNKDIHFNSSEGELLTDEKYYLMELKTSGGAPFWLIQLLNELEIYPCSFSKYGKVYQKERSKNNAYKYISNYNELYADNRSINLYPNVLNTRICNRLYSYENQ